MLKLQSKGNIAAKDTAMDVSLTSCLSIFMHLLSMIQQVSAARTIHAVAMYQDKQLLLNLASIDILNGDQDKELLLQSLSF